MKVEIRKGFMCPDCRSKEVNHDIHYITECFEGIEFYSFKVLIHCNNCNRTFEAVPRDY